MKYTAAVISVSDMGGRGLRQDTSGHNSTSQLFLPAVRAMLEKAGFSVAHTAILPDEMEQISAELLDLPEVQKQHRQIAEEHKDEYLHITCGLFAEDCTGLRG